MKEHNKMQKVSLNVFPNPFSDVVTIKFQIPNDKSQMNDKDQTTLKIYDAVGQLVKSFPLSADYLLPSTSLSWDGTDNFGQKLPSGVYFLHLRTEKKSVTKKCLFLK